MLKEIQKSKSEKNLNVYIDYQNNILIYYIKILKSSSSISF